MLSLSSLIVQCGSITTILSTDILPFMSVLSFSKRLVGSMPCFLPPVVFHADTIGVFEALDAMQCGTEPAQSRMMSHFPVVDVRLDLSFLITLLVDAGTLVVQWQ